MCRNSFPTSYRTCPHDAILLIDLKELEPGSIFNNTYRIVRPLGRGGMGVVYLAEHTLLRQPRALKFLAAELMASPHAAARLALYAKACDGGVSTACANAGISYYRGLSGTTLDRERGLQLLKKSCTMGSEFGCHQLQKIQSSNAPHLEQQSYHRQQAIHCEKRFVYFT